MPITKLGEELMEKNAIISALYGGYKASNLSDDERNALIKKYNLGSDANLVIRNAGRGYLGGAIGGFAGSLPGAVAGALLGHPLIGAQLGGIAGAFAGTSHMANKYSKENAQKIMAQRNK